MNQVTLGDYKPTETWKVASEIMDALKTRISYSSRSARFENDFAAIHGCPYGIISNSGTSALLVAIQALKELRGWKDNEYIAIPALTFVATANAILHAGMIPFPVDIDPETLQLDMENMSIMPYNTRAILPVHLFGNMPDMDALMAFAGENGLAVIEDCCEAFGASHNGKMAGSFGDVGCFSTYVAHHIVTGVGGMCTTRSEELANLMRSLVNHGISDDGLPIGERYDTGHLGRKFEFVRIGHSFRVTEIEAILGLDQISNWDWRIERRRSHAALLATTLMATSKLGVMKIRPGVRCSYMVFPVIANEMTNLEAIAILNKHNIEGRMAMPLTNQPCYPWMFEEIYPQSAWVNRHGFYVGCHEHLTVEQVEHAAKIICQEIR